MDVICTDASPLPPSIPPTPLMPPTIAPRAPGLWAALGLIALYFVLQAAASTLLGLAIGMAAGFVPAQQGLVHVVAEVRSTLEQPGMQALMVMFTLVVAAPLTLLVAQRKWPSLWSLAKPPGFGFTLPARPLFFALAAVIGLAAPLLGGLLTQLLAQGHAVTQDIQQLGSSTPLTLRLPLVLIVVSLGPLVEELLFRGVLLSALMRRWHAGWAIAISSLLFALIHLQGLNFLWYAVPNLALLAAALAWLRLRSGSIWPGVLAHGVNNLLAVLVWFVAAHPPG